MKSSSEKRAAQRRSLRYGARLDFGDGKLPLACALRDVSASGARIMLLDDSLESVPEEFDLVLARSARRHCTLVRRNGREIGVRFVFRDEVK